MIPGKRWYDSRAAFSRDEAGRQAGAVGRQADRQGLCAGRRPALGGSAGPQPAAARLKPSVLKTRWKFESASSAPRGFLHLKGRQA